MNTDLSKLTIKDKTPRSNNRLLPLSIPVILLFLGGYIVGRFSTTKEEAPQRELIARSREKESAPEEHLSTPLPQQGQLFNATGYVVAQRSAAVASKATGRLKELRVVEGDKVRQGEVIGILENDDVAAALKEREAMRTQLTANERAAQAEIENAKIQRDRFKKLLESNSVSQQEFDSAVMRLKKAYADLEAVQAQKIVNEAQIQRANVELQYTYIIAPFDGTVLTKSAEVGEIVAPFGSSTNARAAVVTVADMDSLQIEADVSEMNLPKVYVGQSCVISLDSIPGKSYQGKVVKIVPTVDKAKATVLTKIAFLDKGSEVIPQMSAKIECAIRSGAEKAGPPSLQPQEHVG